MYSNSLAVNDQHHPSPDAPPATLALNPAGIPAELAALRQWVAWEWRPSGKPAKPWTKVPINPTTGRLASTTDPATWGTADAAIRYMGNDRAGVGFVFGADDDYFGIDLDGCRDPVTGKITPAAAATVERFGTYTEISVSGTGIHIIGRADHVPAQGNRTGSIEYYASGRYFTFTGAALRGYDAITNCTDELLAWHAETFPAKPAPPPITAIPLQLDDRDLLERCLGNAKFRALHQQGDIGDYGGDASAADLGYLGVIVRNGGSPEQAALLYRESAIARSKWDERRGTTTYGERTTARAFDGTVVPFLPETMPPRGQEVNMHDGDLPPSGVTDPCSSVRDELSQLRAENASLLRRLADRDDQLAATRRRAEEAEARTKGAIAENKRLADFHSAAMALLGNSELNPSERIVALMTMKEVAADDRGDPDGTEHFIPADRIASRAGVSTGTVAAAVKRLTDGLVVPDAAGGDPIPVRVLTRTVRWGASKVRTDAETGRPVDVKQTFYSRVNTDLAGDVRTLAQAVRVDPRNHGGKRPPCPSCGSTRRTTICADCQTVLYEEPVTPPVSGANVHDGDLHPPVASSSTNTKSATYHNDNHRPLGKPLAPSQAAQIAAARVDWLARKERRSESHVHDDPPQVAVGLPGLAAQGPPPLDSRTDSAYGARRCPFCTSDLTTARDG